MSTSKKINNFLQRAKKEEVIGQDAYEKLFDYNNKESSESGANLFVMSVGLIGALAVIFGVVLIISHNWWKISDAVKIMAYVTTLAGVHLVAVKISKNYPRISSILHFIGAAYVLAGIGLIAQIYHLSSTDGKAFLVWFILIAPLAIILKSNWIANLSGVAFFGWVFKFLPAHGFIDSLFEFVFHSMILSVWLIIFAKVCKTEKYLKHLKIFGFITVLTLVIIMGFSHEILRHAGRLVDIKIHSLIWVILGFNIISLAYLSKLGKSLYDIRLSALLIAAIVFTAFTNMQNLIILSAIYWLIGFLFGALFVVQGSLTNDKTLINIGTWYIILGVITRFIDIVGTMLFTGYMFIIFGILLVGIAFLGEKYRKNLIDKISKKTNA
jgi:uncharacterized membrane protein